MENKIYINEKEVETKNLNTFKLIFQLWTLFNYKTKKLIIKTFYFGIILASLEVLTVFSILPILEIISLKENKLNFLGQFFNIEDRYFLILPIILFLLFIAFITWMKFFIQQKIYELSALIDNNISFSTYQRIIYPASNLDFLTSGISKVLTTMYADIQKAIRVISNVVILSINLICALAIFFVLIVREPFSTLFVASVLLILLLTLLNLVIYPKPLNSCPLFHPASHK